MRPEPIKDFARKYHSAKIKTCKENQCHFDFIIDSKVLEKVVYSGDKIIGKGKSCDCIYLLVNISTSSYHLALVELKNEKVRNLRPIIQKFINSVLHQDIKELSKHSRDIHLYLVHQGMSTLTLKKYRKSLTLKTLKGNRLINLKRCRDKEIFPFE